MLERPRAAKPGRSGITPRTARRRTAARPLELDELLEHFTFGASELEQLRGKAGATRLGFGLILKFLIWTGRFPESSSELPDNAVEHVARQVGVPAADISSYDWSARQIKRHRVEIRRALGHRARRPEPPRGQADTTTPPLERRDTPSLRSAQKSCGR